MKENFAIMTDAGGDFTREIIAKYGIEETPISTVVWPDGSERPTDLYWDTMKPDEYFALMNNKKNNFASSIPSPQTMIDRLSALAEAGRNVVVFTISSSMSGGFSAFTVAANEVMEKYPNIQIVVIDSLRYSAALTLLAVEASLCREKEMSFDDTVTYLKVALLILMRLFCDIWLDRASAENESSVEYMASSSATLSGVFLMEFIRT